MCSYCGCDSIEVIGRFMSEHVEIINATGKLRRAVLSADEDQVATTKAAVADLLWPHTVAEETGLFRVMARDEVFAAHISLLCDEHEALSGLLDAVRPGDATGMARFEDMLREHIEKEDNGLFPAAAIALDGPDWVEVHAVTPHSHDGGAPHVHAEPHQPAADPHVHAEPLAPAADQPQGRGHVQNLATSLGLLPL